LQDVEAEDTMDELIGRSLIYSNCDEDEKMFYYMHDIQLGFLKEKMVHAKKLKGFQQQLVQRFAHNSVRVNSLYSTFQLC